MTQLVISGYDMNGLSPAGLQVLKAAWNRVLQDSDAGLRTVPLEEFCAAAGLPSMSEAAMLGLLREAQRVVAWFEGVDTDNSHDVEWGLSSPMFDVAHVANGQVMLQTYRRLLEANRLSATALPDLQALQVATRKKPECRAF